MLTSATDLFENALTWLKENYRNFRFFVERDIVWTVQNQIFSLVEQQNLPYRVFHNYPIMPGKRGSICTDLAILGTDGLVEVVSEFKYEPAHIRGDIWPSKFPVVFWGDEGVKGDIKRIKQFVAQNRTKIAYSIFIDEAGYFRHREPYEGSEWVDWGPSVVLPYHIWVLFSVVATS